MAAGEWRPPRRRLIQTGATGAAGAAVAATPAVAAAKRTRPRRKADVIVVGAGLAGLMTARKLRAAGKSVIVMEAQNRVGGRTLSEDIGGGGVAQPGGTVLRAAPDPLAAPCQEPGLPTLPTLKAR